jgi:hypothetical protein
MKTQAHAAFAVLISLCLIVAPRTVKAQTFNLHGRLADTAGKPVPNGAVSLLSTADSTMEAFGVSDATGLFEIRAVKAGSYLLQVAGIGYAMLYKPVSMPVSGNDLGFLVLHEDSHLLQEIEVKGAKVPVLMRGDTVEYNAGSFRVREDAVVEELLKKLPGVQVDNAGNVKAMGKDVQRVLVDGKEFFGNDPKMATKNLPADAIDKVQVFGKHSDASRFTGIDDGVRDQTINLQMKKDHRNGYFGNVEGGGGTDAHYQGAARVFRFKPEQQIAALGMLNNINRFGFSFQDYLSFNGGLQSLAGGNGQLNFSDDMPVDFGQPVSGLITSGAAGINYSADSKKGNRVTLSYLGNGADKQLEEQAAIQNFSPAGNYVTRDDRRRSSRDYGHRINAGWRTQNDTVNQINLQGSARLTDNRASRRLRSTSSLDGQPRNDLNSLVQDKATGYELDGSGSFIHKTGNTAWPVWNLSGSVHKAHVGATTDWNNVTSFLIDTTLITDRQYQRNETDQLQWTAGAGVTRKLGRGLYLEPEVTVKQNTDAIHRSQGRSDTDVETDSLSARFSRSWTAVMPSLGIRYNTGKTQLSLGLEAEAGSLQRGIESRETKEDQYTYFTPSLFYQYSWQQSTQLSLNYNTELRQPSAVQMLPVTNYLNPLQRVRGNDALRPELAHTLMANWVRFDQFSGTSLMVHARGVYTKDKISWARYIRPDLSDDLVYRNVADDYLASAGAEFSTPVRKLGINLTLGLDEQFNQGRSFVNELENINRTFTHTGQLRVQTIKLKYLDIETGISGDITQAKATVNAGRRTQFYHYNASAQILWKPHTRFNMSLNGTLDQYTATGFEGAVTVPLLNASASWFFLKFNRGVLTLDGFDLLNRNSAVRRISQLNVLMDQRSNIIRQYVMLSFKYRLSKTGSGESGVTVKVN